MCTLHQPRLSFTINRQARSTHCPRQPIKEFCHVEGHSAPVRARPQPVHSITQTESILCRYGNGPFTVMPLTENVKPLTARAFVLFCGKSSGLRSLLRKKLGPSFRFSGKTPRVQVPCCFSSTLRVRDRKDHSGTGSPGRPRIRHLDLHTAPGEHCKTR